MKRKSWNEYFMDLAALVASRSTCLRRYVGAVAVKDQRIIATGYNGAPPGHDHCLEIGCYRQQLGIPSGERQELCRAVHAEANIVAQCTKFGVSLNGTSIYLWGGSPCLNCAKLLVTAGVQAVYCNEFYPDHYACWVLYQSNVILEQL